MTAHALGSPRQISKTVEWPKGSGRTASYDQDELVIMGRLARSGAPHALKETGLVHALKVAFPGSVLR